MQATDQEDTAKIAISKAKSIQQPEDSAFIGKIQFKPIVAISAPRIASSSVRLSIYKKKLRWTTTPKREHLKAIAIDGKKLKIPVISVELEGNKEKLIIDTGASASFVAAE